MNQHLYRSPDDRILAGVAGGMAETYDLDPSLVRVGWALLILLTGGVSLVLYIIMALVVPLRASGMSLWNMAAQGAPGSVPPGPPSGYNAPGYGRYRRNDNTGPIVIGLLLIVVGAFFLARQFIPALNAGLIWPLIVIAGGVLLIVAAFTRNSHRA